MMRILFLLSAFLFFHFCRSEAQFKLYESTFAGGVVSGGYSNGATVPSGSGSFNVVIPSGSTIRRAYLLAGRVGPAPDVTVTLNGTPFTFSAANEVTSGWTTIYGGASAVHAIDVTASISPATSAYTIAVPAQSTVSNKYPEFYLWIAFDNSSLPVVNAAIFLNVLSATSTYNWTIATTAAVTNTNPVGLAIFGGYAAAGSDCENVNVNGTGIGNFSGTDFNASSMWGAMAGFQYYNGTLTGYNDDNANQPMSGPDALSNIQALLPASTTSFPVTFTHCGGGTDNHVFAVFLTWGDGAILDQGLAPVRAWRLENSAVKVWWEMVSSEMADVFFIERSLNGIDFETAGSVQNLRDGKKEFSFTDAASSAGLLWYRIRYTDPDGKAHVSEKVSVSGSESRELVREAFPNPVHQGEVIHFDVCCDENVQVEILSAASGAVVIRSVLSAGDYTFSTQPLSAGIYIAELKGCGSNGQIKFVVQ